MTPLRRRGPACAEEGADLLHRERNLLLRLLPREHAHLCVRREHRCLHRNRLEGGSAAARSKTGLRVRIVEDGEVPRCRQTPFAALPSMRSDAFGYMAIGYEEPPANSRRIRRPPPPRIGTHWSD